MIVLSIVYYLFNVNNKGNRTTLLEFVLMSLLLTLKIFNTTFSNLILCFYL